MTYLLSRYQPGERAWWTASRISPTVGMMNTTSSNVSSPTTTASGLLVLTGRKAEACRICHGVSHRNVSKRSTASSPVCRQSCQEGDITDTTATWPGQNLLGVALAEVRATLAAG